MPCWVCQPCLVTGPSQLPLQEWQMMKTFLHLVNVNEDPQLTGVLRYFIPAGTPPWWLILVLLMPPVL